MLVAVNHPPIPNKNTPAPAQAAEEFAITKADNTIGKRIENMMKAFEALTFHVSKAN